MGGGLYWAYVKFIRAAPTQEDGEDDTASVHTNATGSTDGTTVTDPTDGGNANTTPGPTDGPTVGGNVNVLPPLARGTYVLHRGILHRVSGDNNELTRHDNAPVAGDQVYFEANADDYLLERFVEEGTTYTITNIRVVAYKKKTCGACGGTAASMTVVAQAHDPAAAIPGQLLQGDVTFTFEQLSTKAPTVGAPTAGGMN